ncbi:MAG TPA: hypothetical protein VFT12_11160, partial [Thermoanaerobaculia bacterium]|nr:hypothetical protein [Thermoanaerobaculia bacterium]
WPEVSPGTFEAGDAGDLRDNLVAVTRSAPAAITSGGFRLLVVATGQWDAARTEVRRVLEAVVPELVNIIGAEEDARYLVVLLPATERGGESFRGSFAMNYEATPSAANRADWGNTIAHEVFHSWNGWRMQGADYASSQWFQEGFTEYAANLAMVSAGLIDEETFRQKLSRHVRNYERLATPLDAPGSRKGPPLYSGGALVALTWDVMLRDATRGERNIRDVYHALWEKTDEGRQPYAWSDIEAALNAVANLNWEDFHRRYIAGTERLPLDDVLRKAGLKIVAGEVGRDPAASPQTQALWQSMTGR